MSLCDFKGGGGCGVGREGEKKRKKKKKRKEKGKKADQLLTCGGQKEFQHRMFVFIILFIG
jgi:hypothetical protein